MDVDDTGLMAQLRGLCTNDRDSMVQEFIQIVGDNKVTAEEAKFYLEMTAWKLSEAIGSYYDNGQQNQQFLDMATMESTLSSLGMTLVQDANPEEVVPANVYFKKIFTIKNTGLLDWPEGCEIRFVDGTPMQQLDAVSVPAVQVGAEYAISIPMISPIETGSYQSQWRIYTANDWSFGDSIFCIVNVDKTLDGGSATFPESWLLQPLTGSEYGGLEDVAVALQNQSGVNGRPSTPNNEPDDMME